MPKGVEHWLDENDLANLIDVILPLMPKGVEHTSSQRLIAPI